MLYANTGNAPRQTLEPGQLLATDAPWLDLLDPTQAEREAAERLTGLRVPSRDAVAEIESSSRLYTEDGVLYASMPFSFLGPDGRSQLAPVGFVLSDRHLLTLRYAALPAFDVFADRFAQGGSPDGAGAGQPDGATQPGDATRSAAIFVGLAETIVDRVADVLERVAGELDSLSASTFASDKPHANARRTDRRLRSILTSVGRCGGRLGNLRDSVLSLGRIAAFAEQGCGRWAPHLKDRLVTLRQDIASLNDYEQQLNAKNSFLLDAVLGFINIEQNNSVKVLTVVSVVGIPPTFVVGLYGMNFKNMPEYDWTYGYPYAWALILLSVVVPLVWFRVKGWI